MSADVLCSACDGSPARVPSLALTPCPPLPSPTVAQVIRSRDRLLDQLYTYLMSLKEFEIDALLAEDPTLVKR